MQCIYTYKFELREPACTSFTRLLASRMGISTNLQIKKMLQCAQERSAKQKTSGARSWLRDAFKATVKEMTPTMNIKPASESREILPYLRTIGAVNNFELWKGPTVVNL